MSKLILAVNLDLGAELSEEELASLTEALLHKFTESSIETIREELEESHRGLKGSVTIDRMEPVALPASVSPTLDESETAKAGARAALEAQAIHCEERADEHDTAVLIALAHNTSDPDALEDIHIESGIAGGFRAAAVYARGAIDAL